MYIIDPISWLGGVALPRGLLLCITIVAAFQLQAAARSPVSEDVPLAPAVAGLVRSLGIDIDERRPFVVAEAARLLYTGSTRPSDRPPADPSNPAPADSRTVPRVPIPLTTAVWSESIFH